MDIPKKPLFDGRPQDDPPDYTMRRFPSAERGGTFRIVSYTENKTTASLPYNATAEEIQAAIDEAGIKLLSVEVD